MSENLEISYPSGVCYEHTDVETMANVNPTESSETLTSGNSSEKIDSFVADIGDKCAGESMTVTEHEVHTTPRTTKRGARADVPSKRRQTSTVLWEPLLVPTEVDGKYEMITALKRVDSDYISSPRINPRIVGAQIVKDAKLAATARMEAQSTGFINPSSKVTVGKTSSDTEFKHGVKKDFTKKKVPDLSEQMGKAIAEKEAAILKEIEKAMKEANIRNKSDKSTKSKISPKISPTQYIKKKNEPHDSISQLDPSENLSDVEKDAQMKHSSPNKDVTTAAKIQNTSSMSKTVSSPSLGFVTKEVHGLSKVSAVRGKVAALSSPGNKPITKETQSMNRILQVPRTVMITPSTGGTIPKDIQVKNKILCGPATVVAPSTPTAVITTRDAQAINQVITVPVSTNANPQTLTEISPNTGTRILLLASPSAGGIPFLTPILPATSIPIMQAPVSAPVMTIARGTVEKVEPPRITSTKARKGKDFSFTLPGTTTQIIGSDTVTIEDCDVLKMGSSKKTGPAKKVTSSCDSVCENKQSPVPQSTQSSSEIMMQIKHQKVLPPQYTTAKRNQNNTDQGGDKNALTASPVKFGKSEAIEKQNKTVKQTSANNTTMNGKTAEKTPTEKSVLQISAKDQQRADCNGESMDVDDISFLEELDQGFVDDTRNISCQNLSLTEKSKYASLSEENKHHTSEPKRKSSRKTLQNESSDRDSQDVLEKRLQRMEQLFNEIPPVKARLSFSEEEYSKVRDGFRNSMHTIKSITASFQDLINQSSSLSCKGLTHSSCQTETVITETIVENISTEEVTNEKSEVIDDDDDLILCRLCGGFFKAESLIYLFGKLSKKKNLLSMLSAILPQANPVKEADGLPQQVCEACIEKLTLCHSIISQFLQADKELRQVLTDEKPFSSDSLNSEESCAVHPQENLMTSEEIVPTPDDDLQTQQNDLTVHSSTKEGTGEEFLKEKLKSSQEEPHGEKRRHTHAEVESTNAEKSLPSPKRKRRRSKSSSESASINTTKSSAPSTSSSGCIDLSRLDPEFNDGFEVEWCLDEETIRSSMVPEEDVSPGLSEETAVSTLRVTAGGASEAEKGLSAAPGSQECADSQSGKLELHQAANPNKKKKDTLGSETSEHIDEVSKLSEVPTSLCRSPVKSGNKQIPVSTDPQEKYDVQLNVLTQSPNLKCSSCPLSFHSKQELMLHQVMQHEKADSSKRPEGKQDVSNAIRSKNLPPKQISSPDSKIENESCEESVMCDQCGLPFPNEYSLCLHKNIIHGTSVNSQLIIKDSKGLEYKIVNSEETLEENATHQEISETALSDGKILVKCGNGMLWVNCSKYFSEEQMAAVQSSDLTEVNYVNVENGTVALTDQSSSTISPQSVAKVQFAYKCDHCKQIFPSRAELLPHMQVHLKEKYNCSECGAKFASVKALNNHITIHVPLDRVCDVCGLILVDSKKLVQHRKEHTHNLPHVCETCGKRFPNEQTLEVHETIHYSKKGPLACSLCRKYFFFKHSLVRHRSQHASNRLQKCSLCFRVLNSSDQLRKHVALHHLMKNFVCFCKQTFPSQKELVEHRYLKHSYAEIFCARNKVEIIEPLPLHQCSVCLRVLNSKQSLQKHHATSHNSTWPFFCIQCSRKYTSKYHLARHECHRKNTSSFQCKICGKAFQNKNVFKQHKVIHNNRKWRYICRHCGKTFQKSQSLVSHIMTHGGKKFLCPRCHQPCQDKEGLLKHYNNGSCQMKRKTLQ